jgi:acetyl-CoA carboxylase biotin carboxyl carrier protein
MSRHELNEIDLRQGDHRIRLRRGTRKPQVPPPPASTGPAPGLPSIPAAPPTAPAADKPTKPELEIKSPTPGTFYASPSPEAEPFVRVGSRVTPSTVVCIIEAMKIFNEIQAECNGVVTAVLADNQQPVEYGQVLFKVDPTA